MPNIINVGASTSSNQTADYSNYGRHGVHIFAPSGLLLPFSDEDAFRTFYGTSFAAPVVSGSIALIRSKYPQLSAAQVKHAVLSTCKRDKAFIGRSNEI